MKRAWSKLAIQELREVRRYAAGRWGRDVALRSIQDVRDAAKRVACEPATAKILRDYLQIMRAHALFGSIYQRDCIDRDHRSAHARGPEHRALLVLIRAPSTMAVPGRPAHAPRLSNVPLGGSRNPPDTGAINDLDDKLYAAVRRRSRVGQPLHECRTLDALPGWGNWPGWRGTGTGIRLVMQEDTRVPRLRLRAATGRRRQELGSHE